MNKKKLQKFICAGTLLSTTLNLTPVSAFQKESSSYSTYSLIDSQHNIQLLSESNDDEDIDYEEEEGSGQIIVKHIDVDTGLPISSGEVYDDIPYGETKVYSTLKPAGYELQGPKEYTVTVSKNKPVVTVVFKYKSTSSNTKPNTGTKPGSGNNSNTGGSNNNTQKPSSGNSNNNTTQKPSSGNNNNTTQKPSSGNNNNNTTQKPSSGNNSSNTQKPNTSTSNNNSSNTTKPIADTNKENKTETPTTLGSVTINLIDANSGEIFKTIKKDGLSLSEAHTYSATEEDGYTLLDKSSKVVNLSDEKSHEAITFAYIKNNSVATFGRARIQEAYDNKEDFVAYSTSGNVLIDESLLKAILDNDAEEITLNLNDEISNMDVVEEISSSTGLNVVSAFSLSSNLNSEVLNGNIVVTKNLDSTYNDKTVYIYELSSENSVDYIGENIVADGMVSFDASLPAIETNNGQFTTEYLISDVKLEETINENSEDINEYTDNQEIQVESVKETSSSIAIYIVTGIVAAIGAIFGSIKLLKNKKKK